jgi:excisionase family DNA binding protein
MMSIYDEMARMETARRKANSRLSRRERIEEELDQWEYTVPEAAEVLGEHPKTIYRRIKNREIRACYELGQKSHRNADFTVSLVPSRSLFPAFLSRF